MKIILAPSLLSADFSRLGQELEKMQAAGVQWLHLDVMDGSFVPNITFGAPVIAALRKNSSLFFDVHLMIEEPERYIRDFAQAGADLITVHLETMRHPQKTLAEIQSYNIHPGLALNPATNMELCRWLLPWTDLIMLMGVNPGFSGQKFLPQTIEKIRFARQYLISQGHAAMPIEVDGGVTPVNVPSLAEAGANVLVSGSAFFREQNYAASLAAFMTAAEQIQTTQKEDPASLWRHNG